MSQCCNFHSPHAECRHKSTPTGDCIIRGILTSGPKGAICVTTSSHPNRLGFGNKTVRIMAEFQRQLLTRPSLKIVRKIRYRRERRWVKEVWRTTVKNILKWWSCECHHVNAGQSEKTGAEEMLQVQKDDRDGIMRT